ncbi:MAG: rod shape-determining protein MreC, partial [Treponema sp.]|nr:rod shape-determining protein MreC [Treponema sp.]
MRKTKLAFRFHLDAFLLTVYLILSAVFLAFSAGGLVVNFRSFGFNLMSGTQRGLYSVTSFFSGTVTAIRELSELKERYEALEDRLKDYELLQRSNADIRLENERLKELLGFTESLTVQNIPARIIARDPNNLYSGITINRGVRHGVKKNMPVISFQGSNTGLV